MRVVRRVELMSAAGGAVLAVMPGRRAMVGAGFSVVNEASANVTSGLRSLGVVTGGGGNSVFPEVSMGAAGFLPVSKPLTRSRKLDEVSAGNELVPMAGVFGLSDKLGAVGIGLVL